MIECVQDKNGLHVIVIGVLQGTIISILNIYYPPTHLSDFVMKVLLDFSEIHSDIAIVGGDFNCILNPLIDRFPHKDMPLSTQAITQFCKQRFRICWCVDNSSLRQGIHFFLHPLHHTRIAFLKLYLNLVLSCLIGSIFIWDHTSVVLDLSLKRKRVKQWRPFWRAIPLYILILSLDTFSLLTLRRGRRSKVC